MASSAAGTLAGDPQKNTKRNKNQGFQTVTALAATSHGNASTYRPHLTELRVKPSLRCDGIPASWASGWTQWRSCSPARTLAHQSAAKAVATGVKHDDWQSRG
eukprot:3019204-Amphidinium_carterae.1